MQSNLYDVVITRAAHQLRPGYLNEQERSKTWPS
jgi:hypothetical protein